MTEQVLVPNIGGASNVEVIEVLVKPGDVVEKETSLITLEGDKATMEVPSPFSGKVTEIKVKPGDKVSEGSVILSLETDASKKENQSQTTEKKETENKKSAKQGTGKEETTKKENGQSEKTLEKESSDIGPFDHDRESIDVHAGPAVRRIAQEIGLNLSKLIGTGEKGRILKQDIKQYVQSRLESVGSGIGLNLSPIPAVDFAQFGEVTQEPLSRIQKISGSHLHRNWVRIPHITQFGEADITELESFRQSYKPASERDPEKLTPLVFIMKATVAALKAFPHFNASLDSSSENLILKKYFNIGIAVDTLNGLVVPVIRDVDKKSLTELARELSEISQKAKTKGLSMTDMQGGCFSISSLGGIGGTAFTPIINAPEVAILGVSKSQMKPLFDEQSNEFIPRLMLPLSLSYDHRVIDGADGARFMMYLSSRLSEIRMLLL